MGLYICELTVLAAEKYKVDSRSLRLCNQRTTTESAYPFDELEILHSLLCTKWK
jgi:hypothetical protein